MGGVVAAITTGTIAALCGVGMAEYPPAIKSVADECFRATTELMNHPDVVEDEEEEEEEMDKNLN